MYLLIAIDGDVTTQVQWVSQVPLGLAHHYPWCTLKNYSQEGADYQT